MFLKLMRRVSGEFRVLEIVECEFHQLEQTISYKRTLECITETETLEANAYLVDGNGHTIEAFKHTGKKP